MIAAYFNILKLFKYNNSQLSANTLLFLFLHYSLFLNLFLKTKENWQLKAVSGLLTTVSRQNNLSII